MQSRAARRFVDILNKFRHLRRFAHKEPSLNIFCFPTSLPFWFFCHKAQNRNGLLHFVMIQSSKSTGPYFFPGGFLALSWGSDILSFLAIQVLSVSLMQSRVPLCSIVQEAQNLALHQNQVLGLQHFSFPVQIATFSFPSSTDAFHPKWTPCFHVCVERWRKISLALMIQRLGGSEPTMSRQSCGVHSNGQTKDKETFISEPFIS